MITYSEIVVDKNLEPALKVMAMKANESKTDTFTVSDNWRAELEQLAKLEVTYLDTNGNKVVDNVLKFVDIGNGDIVVKFSQYLPRDQKTMEDIAKSMTVTPKKKDNEPLVKGTGEPVRIAKVALPKCTNNCVDIVKVDAAKNLVYGVVLVPGSNMNAAAIELQAHNYAVKSRLIENEDGTKANVQLVENCIAPINDYPFAGQNVKKGTWVVVLKVNDPDTMSGIQDSCLRVGA